MTLCTNVLLFLYVLCWIWWYWRDVLVLLRRNSREWQLGDGISWLRNSGQYSSGVMIWSVKSPPTVSSYWRLVFVTFGCVTLPRRFRLGIVFGGEVWRSATRRWILLTYARQFLLWAYFTYLCDYEFCVLVYFRRWFHQKVPGLHVCLVVMAGNCFWCILEEMFLVVWRVYNGRLCGRSFSWTSGEVVAVRRVGVFLLVRFA